MSLEDVVKIVDDEFYRLRELKNKYENTPNGYKYEHKFMAVRDLRNKIKSNDTERKGKTNV